MRRRFCRRARSCTSIGFLDTTPANKNPADAAQLGGRRPPLGREHVHRPRLLRVDDRGTVPGRDGHAAREDEEPQRLRHRLSALLGAARRASRRPRPRNSREEPAVIRRGERPRPRPGRPIVVAIACLACGARRRADPLLLLVGPAARAGLRRMDAERRRVVHAVLRLHEHELACRSSTFPSVRTTGSSRADRRHGAADALLSAPESVPVHRQVPSDFGDEGAGLDLTANGQTRKAYAYAEDRLPDRQAGDLDRSRRRQRQPRRRAPHERAAGAEGRRRARRGRSRLASRSRWSRLPAIPTTCRRAATASRSPA